MHEIDKKTRRRELALSDYYKERVGRQDNCIYEEIKEHLFVVARRWNSWYPSFFDVAGGCYAVVNPICNKQKRHPVAIIDPGFRHIKVLGDLGISIKDVETCIISHNHPDHLGGVFEYITSRRAAEKESKLFCNSTTFGMFSGCNQEGFTVTKFDSQRQNLLDYTDINGNKRELTMGSFKTEHEEIGGSSDARGLIIEFSNSKGEHRVVILGDTTYEIGTHKERYMKHIIHQNTRVVVLHIGSAQLKMRVGGHLYLRGLNRIITTIGEELESAKWSKSQKMIVIISEWGLEHATRVQIEQIASGVEKFDKTSLILESIEFLKEGLTNLGYIDRVTIIPGDIGLMVGIESGMIYWLDNEKLKSATPDNLRWRTSDEGLEYYCDSSLSEHKGRP